jgi:hypothetical protein
VRRIGIHGGRQQKLRELIKKLMALSLILALSTPAHASAAANSCPKWEPLLAEYFPAKVVPIMSKISYRESRCISTAIGWNYKPGMSHKDCKISPASTYRKCPAVKSFDSGILQVNSTWVTVTRAVCKKQDVMKALLNPRCNVKVAQYLYRNGGLGHWRATSGK